MNYDMEDTQNSAPGSLPSAQASKLAVPRKGPDAQSTTKRYVSVNSQAEFDINGEMIAYKQS
jgi:hypothetical protein